MVKDAGEMRLLIYSHLLPMGAFGDRVSDISFFEKRLAN